MNKYNFEAVWAAINELQALVEEGGVVSENAFKLEVTCQNFEMTSDEQKAFQGEIYNKIINTQQFPILFDLWKLGKLEILLIGTSYCSIDVYIKIEDVFEVVTSLVQIADAETGDSFIVVGDASALLNNSNYNICPAIREFFESFSTSEYTIALIFEPLHDTYSIPEPSGETPIKGGPGDKP